MTLVRLAKMSDRITQASPIRIAAMPYVVNPPAVPIATNASE
jgi:hypothetical protein